MGGKIQKYRYCRSWTFNNLSQLIDWVAMLHSSTFSFWSLHEDCEILILLVFVRRYCSYLSHCLTRMHADAVSHIARKPSTVLGVLVWTQVLHRIVGQLEGDRRRQRHSGVIGDRGGQQFCRPPKVVRCPCPLTILMLAAKLIIS